MPKDGRILPISEDESGVASANPRNGFAGTGAAGAFFARGAAGLASGAGVATGAGVVAGAGAGVGAGSGGATRVGDCAAGAGVAVGPEGSVGSAEAGAGLPGEAGGGAAGAGEGAAGAGGAGGMAGAGGGVVCAPASVGVRAATTPRMVKSVGFMVTTKAFRRRRGGLDPADRSGWTPDRRSSASRGESSSGRKSASTAE